MKRFLGGLLAISALVGALVVAGTPGAELPQAKAASGGCWQFSHSQNGGTWFVRDMFKSNLWVEWCSRDGRITEFRVLRCETSVKRPWAVRDPHADCRQRTALGRKTLPIFGEFNVAKALGTVRLDKFGEWVPGRSSIHYEITLLPDGHVDVSVDWPS